MIKINLAPIDESDDKFWMLPDLAAVGAGVLAALLVTGFFLDKVRGQIADTNTEIANRKAVLDGMQGELNEFDAVNEQIKKLQDRRRSITSITESKLSRYLPIILMEHLQNLKPEGVWFTKVSFQPRKVMYGRGAAAGRGPAPAPVPEEAMDPNLAMDPTAVARNPNLGSMVLIQGHALSTAILAEFMAAVRATRTQEFEATDLRSQVYFPLMGMTYSESRAYTPPFDEDLTGTGPGIRNAVARMPSMDIPEFEVWLHFAERPDPKKGVPTDPKGPAARPEAPAPNAAPAPAPAVSRGKGVRRLF